MSVVRLLPCLAAALAVGCADPAPPPAEEPADATPAPAAGSFRIFERSIVFLTPTADTAFVVPWLFTARTQPGGVRHTARGWLGRGATWDAFYAERWETPPSRAPWRILPRGSMRLVVGMGDALSTILFEEGQRSLELEFGEGLVEWTGTQGEVIQLSEGALYVADARFEGFIMDMSRNRATDAPPPGDWAVLASGDSLQMVVASRDQQPPGTEGAYRAWGRLDFRDLQWTAVTLDSDEVRAFQPARQDVPVSWTLTSEDGRELRGALRVVSAQIEAGQGPGPLLPVDALFWVNGTLSLEGGTYPVRGLVRHARP